MADGKLIFETIPVGLLQANCTIVVDEETGEAIIFDIGGDPDTVISVAAKLAKNINITRIYHTHAHFDHMLGSGAVAEAKNAKILLNKKDQEIWDAAIPAMRMFGVPVPSGFTPPKVDEYFKEGDTIELGGRVVAKVIETPGHTPGGVCFLFEKEDVLIAGDTIFCGGIGRTDLPGGDFNKLMSSIKNKIFKLKESIRIITGHGGDTTVKRERDTNFFVR